MAESGSIPLRQIDLYQPISIMAAGLIYLLAVGDAAAQKECEMEDFFRRELSECQDERVRCFERQDPRTGLHPDIPREFGIDTWIYYHQDYYCSVTLDFALSLSRRDPARCQGTYFDIAESARLHIEARIANQCQTRPPYCSVRETAMRSAKNAMKQMAEQFVDFSTPWHTSFGGDGGDWVNLAGALRQFADDWEALRQNRPARVGDSVDTRLSPLDAGANDWASTHAVMAWRKLKQDQVDAINWSENPNYQSPPCGQDRFKCELIRAGQEIWDEYADNIGTATAMPSTLNRPTCRWRT